MADFSGCADCGRELFLTERQYAESLQALPLCAPCLYFLRQRWASLLNVIGWGPSLPRRLRLQFR